MKIFGQDFGETVTVSFFHAQGTLWGEGWFDWDVVICNEKSIPLDLLRRQLGGALFSHPFSPQAENCWLLDQPYLNRISPLELCNRLRIQLVRIRWNDENFQASSYLGSIIKSFLEHDYAATLCQQHMEQAFGMHVFLYFSVFIHSSIWHGFCDLAASFG